MADTLLVAGTASHVGKSTVVAGLCRLLAERGVSVAPFKAQNMSNNARAVLTPAGDWGEVGVSQFVQARAAGVTPRTDHNPVLLKPRGDGESQLVVDGEAIEHVPAGEYYERHWETAREAAVAAHERLAGAHDVVVAEGAGSPAEINLTHRDLANVETARFADADVLLLGDIERGGVFASLYGTLELMPADLRDRVGGVAITKFRGDPGLLADGPERFEELSGVPVLGILPYDDPGLPAEDSVSLPDGEGSLGGREGGALGADDGLKESRSVRVGVPRLPRISNFTDLEPLARVPGVRVEFRPPAGGLDGFDAVVLPGSKNTVDDLLALRREGFAEALADFEGPVVGVCGGYQMLGRRIGNVGIESTVETGTVAGLDVLPAETRFEEDKRVEQVTRRVDGAGPIAGATGEATGYEIHMGRTTVLEDRPRPLGPASVATDGALGTYLHGLFENRPVREAFVDAVFSRAGKERPHEDPEAGDPYARAADLVADLDLAPFDLPGTATG